MRSRLAFVIAAAAAVSTPAVHAQTIGDMPYINAVDAWAQTHLLRHRGGDAEDEADAAPGPAQTLAMLEFDPAAAVTREVNRRMAAGLAGGGEDAWPASLQPLAAGALGDPAFRRLLAAELGANPEEMQAAFDSGRLQAAYADVLARAGYSAHNMGDVHAAFLIYAWAILNQRTAPIPPGAFEAVRGTMADAIRQRGDQGLAALDDREMQATSESLALLTMLMVAAWKDAAPGEARVLRDGVAQACAGLGVDLRGVSLTAAGFRR
ncbi:hypothetical protein [Coralloluteibacterium stylophorae]|uniref:Uncharacterized protein n=1 Tax=Coralloluteibacterium stylophorae TaxID=1776034 RepID=A0A8J7VT27_9GAMM|nr:hypothetical protein [Coralloluteibacterium stylophorae]MBS7458787.1 hypothetical protein [Coralloluteibacterium stylophorae]